VEPLGGQASRSLDASSLETTVKKEKARLFDFIRRRIGDESDAEDLLQDVFHQLAASYRVTEPIENLTAWLFTVARRKVIDWFRKRRPAPLPRGTGGDEGPLDLEDIRFDGGPEPDLKPGDPGTV